MKRIAGLILSLFLSASISGCIPLILGGAAGALGAYAVSRDTIQGDTDKPYDSLWSAAVDIAKARGSLRQEDYNKGLIQLDSDKAKVTIQMLRLTRATTRIKITARKYHLPDLELAQDIYVRIMDEVK